MVGEQEISEMKISEEEPKGGIEGTDQTMGNKNHKICFGVYASISHEFILGRERQAEEVSQTLASAFRVLSLTQPEQDVILKTLFKSEGLKSYEELTEKTFRFFKAFREAGKADDATYAITNRDLQRLVKATSAIIAGQWKTYRTEQERQRSAERAKVPFRDAEEEDETYEADRTVRCRIERDAVARALELLVVERYFYDWHECNLRKLS